jgi:hypothetical protein
MFFTGMKTNIGLFSCDNTKSLVADYMENTKKLSEWCWKQILKSCGAEYEKDAVVPAPGMDEQCCTLYTPSSPAMMMSDEE